MWEEMRKYGDCDMEEFGALQLVGNIGVYFLL